MSCTSPLQGFRSKKRTVNGKRSVVFSGNDCDLRSPVEVPCGQCIGCRLEYARNWAIRCMHEASMHEDNCFITLTYDDEHLPEDGSLRPSDFQLFMKRLRSKFSGKVIRFYQCGEYGSVDCRAHHHCLLFGFDFPDKVRWSVRDGYPVWRSNILEKLWKYGFSEIGEVSFESAAYCARYVVKKFKGPKEVMDKWYDGLVPEYATMSRRPGIGASWYEKYGEGVRDFDSVIVNGVEMRPPRFYDRLFEAASPVKFSMVKGRRCGVAKKLVARDGRGDSRLLARQKNLDAKFKLKGGVL